MKKLKVYGGNLDGMHRVIMAASSKAEFCKATGCTPAYFTETGNEIERGVALNEPGVIFVKSDRWVTRGRYWRLGPPPVNYSYLRSLDLQNRDDAR